MKAPRQRAAARLGLLVLLLLTMSGVALADPFAFPRRETFGPAAGRSTAMALGDLNNDGALDLVVGSKNLFPSERTPGYVYLSDGAGTFHVGPVVCGPTAGVWCFGDPTANPAPSIASLALGDLDADGDLDIVAGYEDAGLQDVIFFNDGAGGFGAGAPFGPPGTFTKALAVADLDGRDGLDLIVGARSGQNQVYLNDGSGGFPTGAPFGPGSDPTESLAVGDVDGDGRPDIIAGNVGGQSVLYLNNGVGGFASGVITCGVTPATGCIGGPIDATSGLALGRLDGDADLDLVVIRDGAANQRYLNDGNGTFADAATFGAANSPTRALATGDFDRDGDLDIATGEAGAVNQFYVNDGAGTLSLQAPFGSNTTPSAMRAGDIDSDGDLDLVLNNGGLQSEIYLNSGAGSFAESAARTFGGFEAITVRVAAGDLNNDGNLDLITLRNLRQPLITLLDAQGNPTTSTPFGELTPRYNDLALGDLDGDGDLDLVLVSLGGQNLVLFNQGVGSGVFATGAISCGTTPNVACFGSGDDPTYSVALADLDGDGPLDIVAGNGSSTVSSVYFNRGATFFRGRARCDGSAVPEITCLGNTATRSVAAGDLDGDGDGDIVLGSEGQPNQIFLNDGGGAFRAGGSFGSGSDPTLAVALGDVNGDGRLDIALGNRQDQSAVLLNQGGARFTSSPALCRNSAEATCFGSGLDPIADLAFADMDNDGDLDLLAALTRGQSAVYVNDSGSLTARRTFGDDAAQTTGLAFGDLDHDGDHDLVIGRADQASLIYRNDQAGVNRHAFAPPLLSVQTPGAVAWPAGSAAATIIDTPIITVSYRLSAPVAAVAGFYSLDGGDNWQPAATPANQSRILAPQPEPDGSYRYPWDTFNSGFFGQSDAVIFRIAAYPTTPAFPGAAAGSYQQPYVAAQSAPFRARGTQVQVLDPAGQPVSGALVYRLPRGQARGGTPLGDTGAISFQTAASGYLQGRGRLDPGDRIVALARQPLPTATTLPTDTIRLYYTSAPVSTTLQMAPIRTAGVQTLTIAPDHPLLVFDLTIALEWDARNDTAFLARLSDDLARTGEILYDWSDGQIALGAITLYHDARRIAYADDPDPWSNANMRLFATNRLRPNADRGGVVVTDTLDPDPKDRAESGPPDPFAPGQVRMGAVWNRFGEQNAIGEDWPRTLAHELGHYLLFLDDNYLGLRKQPAGADREIAILVPVSGCRGAMADPYRDDYSEFHPAGREWDTDPNCQRTLSEVESGRADWASILAFYPETSLRAPATYNQNPGPGVLPLSLAQIRQAPVPQGTPVDTLSAPFFSLEISRTGRIEAYTPGANANVRAFLLRRDSGGDGSWLIDLGAPVADRVEARGAAPADQVCVFALETPEHDGAPVAHQGCLTVDAAERPALQVRPTPGWRPEVRLTPVTSTTITIEVANLAEGPAPQTTPVSLTARLYPIDRESSDDLIFILERADGERYTTTATLDQPTFGGYLLIAAGAEPLAIVDYMIGGNPGRKWIGTAPRGSPGRKWIGTAPVLSSDGQALLFTEDDFAEGEFYAIQTASPRAVPAWATPVGQAYQVAATDQAPALDAASIMIGYLSRDVPGGAERYLRIFYLDADGWRPLETYANPEANLLSALLQGPGHYAIFASVPLPPFGGVGWHQFIYPIADPIAATDPISRPIALALSSIDGNYALVYHDTGGTLGSRWELYAPAAPAYVNTLHGLRFAESYAIYITAPTTTTIWLQPALAATMAVPATIYGELRPQGDLIPQPAHAVTARIDGRLCGQTSTRQTGAGQVVFAIHVEADSIATMPGCGAPGRMVQLFYDDWPIGEPIRWDNTRLTDFSQPPLLERHYLPLIRR